LACHCTTAFRHEVIEALLRYPPLLELSPATLAERYQHLSAVVSAALAPHLSGGSAGAGGAAGAAAADLHKLHAAGGGAAASHSQLDVAKVSAAGDQTIVLHTMDVCRFTACFFAAT
jgi:hypothetical protein